MIPFLGLVMIYQHHWDLWRSEWLVLAIVLFTIAFFFGLLVQHPNATRLVSLLRQMPPDPPPEGAAPPPEIVALTRRLQLGGTFLSLMIVALVVLMVWKPGGAVTHP